MKVSVLFYVPNVIGYIRLVLLLLCYFFFDHPIVLLSLYITATFLDGIDGCLARRLGQTSAFGAWLDVLVDNIGRSIVWTRLHHAGIFIVCVEWTVFACTHTLGSHWKHAFGAAPWWVKMVMDNGFYNPAGIFTVAGIHGLPGYLYFYKHLIPKWTFLERVRVLLIVPIVVLGTGRLLCLAVELWCIKTHIAQLTNLEEDRKLHSLTKEMESTDTPS